ncbi:MAG: hypothetical protein GX207_04635 [Peptococcaceae bacterium]|nr:hypothetical protein [Peptococcaceae bacterium]
MKDIFIRSLIAGCLGGLIYQMFVWVFYLFDLAKITPFQIGAYMLVKPGSDFTMIFNQLLGSVQHFSNSILIAFVIAAIAERIGLDHFILKGTALGGILYFIIYGVVGRYIIPVSLLQPDLVTSTIFLAGNLLYGLTVVSVLATLNKKMIT